MHEEDIQRIQEEMSKLVLILRYCTGQLSQRRHIIKINEM